MLVVVDNITDALSPQPSGVKCVPDTMRTIMASAVSKEPKPHDHPAGCPTMDFACMCDAAHGYSVLLVSIHSFDLVMKNSTERLIVPCHPTHSTRLRPRTASLVPSYLTLDHMLECLQQTQGCSLWISSRSRQSSCPTGEPAYSGGGELPRSGGGELSSELSSDNSPPFI